MPGTRLPDPGDSLGSLARPKYATPRVLFLTTCLFAGWAGASVLVNGDFENPHVTGSYAHVTLPGWTSSGNYYGAPVVFTALYSPVGGGNQSVQLEGYHETLSQSFTTIPGATYELMFGLASYVGDPAQVLVSAGNASQAFWASSIYFSTRKLTFTAAGNTTTLTFQSLYSDPHLDDVSIDLLVAPEPSAGWLLPPAALLFPRRRVPTRLV